MAYTDHHVQRWKRRMALRRSLNGSPAVFHGRLESSSSDDPVPDSQLTVHVHRPAFQNPRELASPLPSGCVNITCLPTQTCSTPMPQKEVAVWDCCKRVPVLSSDVFYTKPVCNQTKAFHDSSFKRLFGKLFDSLLKDERII